MMIFAYYLQGVLQSLLLGFLRKLRMKDLLKSPEVFRVGLMLPLHCRNKFYKALSIYM